uniref:VOC family protein n=1 Tax=Vibrio cholerae TaxID=666 RepID=UPI001C105543
SKAFYPEILGLRVLAENYRAARDSYKLASALPDGSQIALFSFPKAPERPSFPASQGLRHLAFVVDGVAEVKAQLEQHSVS